MNGPHSLVPPEIEPQGSSNEGGIGIIFKAMLPQAGCFPSPSQPRDHRESEPQQIPRLNPNRELETINCYDRDGG